MVQLTDPTATPTLFDMVEEKELPPTKKPTPKPRATAKPPKAAPSEPEKPPRKPDAGSRRASAEEMGSRQRDISVAEFFTKNRHLLGFDSPLKALLTAVKEAVDNSLDACEEAGILPEVVVEIAPVGKDVDDRFRMAVEDNGPGIVREQIAKVFGKLLYGSKFHKLSQSRGQQGIGISAAGMYGLLTTGKPVRIVSRTGKKAKAHEFQLSIDTAHNRPDVHDEKEIEWDREHGTRVEIEMEAKYQKGLRSVDMYLKLTAIANPHVTIRYTDPGGEKVVYERSTKELPAAVEEIKPHPHGVELGALMLMAAESKSHDVKGFLQATFSRVSPSVAEEILKRSAFKGRVRPRDLAEDRTLAEKLHKAIGETRIMAPPTNCLSPIGDALMKRGLISFLNVIESEGPDDEEQLDLDQASKKKASKKEKAAKAEAPEVPDAPPEEGVEKIKGHNYFISTVTRPPKVYRGNPFQVEVGLAYGGSWPADKTIELFRFANRVPLQYQASACAISKAVMSVDWRSYGMSMSKGALPSGPMVLMVHIASVWVPFTSESKEAIAHYPEIVKELRLGLMEVGRKLGLHIRHNRRAEAEAKKKGYIEKFIPHIGIALKEILGFSDKEEQRVVTVLRNTLERSREKMV
jgi:DNA topoisomerase-6 subunit B